jgi:hypothetical protein
MMKRKFIALCAVIVLMANFAVNVRAAANFAQTSPATTELLAQLPQADAVMFIDVQRLLSDTLPVTLAGHPNLRQQVDSMINHLNALGLNLRAVDSMAVAFRFERAPRMTSLIRGRFDASLVASTAIRNARQQTLGGRTLYTDNGRREVWAAIALDTNTVAIGELEFVRAGVEAYEGRGRVAPEFVANATRTANAVVGFTARVPPALAQSFGGGGNDEFSQLLAGIQQISGAFVPVGNGGGGLHLRARTENSAQAAELNTMLQSMRDTAARFADSRTEGTSVAMPRYEIIVSSALIRSFNVATEGNEVLINANFTQEEISELLRATIDRPSPPARAPQTRQP